MEDQTEQKVMIELDSVKRFLATIRPQMDEYEEAKNQRWKQGKCFTFMDALGITDNEIRHSQFIANLLDPRGTHGQGDLFLKKFVSKFSNEHPSTEKFDEARIRAEYPATENDRIDIFIDLKSGAKLAIENKIGAKEGPEQIERYQKYLKGSDCKNSKIFFLTPDGREPITAAPNTEQMPPCEPISYGKISEWIKACLGDKRLIGAHTLKVLLRHYADICERIGERKMEEIRNQELQEIIKALKSDDDDLKVAFVVEEAASQIRNDFFKEFWMGVKKLLEEGLKQKNACSEWEVVDKFSGGYIEIKQKGNTQPYLIKIESITRPAGGYAASYGVVRSNGAGDEGSLSETLKAMHFDKENTVYVGWRYLRDGLEENVIFDFRDRDSVMTIKRDSENENKPLATEISELLLQLFDSVKTKLEELNSKYAYK